MPISQYRSLIEQSLNIGILASGRKGFELISDRDKRLEMEWQYLEMIKKGFIKNAGDR